MKRAIPFSLAATLLAAESMQLHIEPPPATQMNLYLEKTGLLSGKKHHFVFERFSGSVDMTTESVTLEIDAASIRCLDTWVSEKDRQKILKVATEDILAARKYPVIRFRSERVTRTDEKHYEVRGLLTIRDASKPVQFVVTRLDDKRFEGEARVRLRDFGLSPPSAALGLVGTKDEMLFTFRISLSEAQS